MGTSGTIFYGPPSCPLNSTIPYHTIILFQATRPIPTIQLNKKTSRQKISRPTEKNVKTQNNVKALKEIRSTDPCPNQWPGLTVSSFITGLLNKGAPTPLYWLTIIWNRPQQILKETNNKAVVNNLKSWNVFFEVKCHSWCPTNSVKALNRILQILHIHYNLQYITLQVVTFFFNSELWSSFAGELAGSFLILITGVANRKLVCSSGFLVLDSAVFDELDDGTFLASEDECDRWWCLLTSEDENVLTSEDFLTSDDVWARWWCLFGSEVDEDDSRWWCLLLLLWRWSFWPWPDCFTSLLRVGPDPGFVDDLCEPWPWPGFTSPDDLCELLCEWCLWPSDDLDRSWDECDLWWCDDDDEECLDNNAEEWRSFEGCITTNITHHQTILLTSMSHIRCHTFYFSIVLSFQ